MVKVIIYPIMGPFQYTFKVFHFAPNVKHFLEKNRELCEYDEVNATLLCKLNTLEDSWL